MESPCFDLNHSKNPANFTVPIDGNREAIYARAANEPPELRHQFRDTSSQPRTDSITGVYSPHDEVPLTEISSKMDGGITGGEESGELRAQVAGVYELTGKENISSTMETHLPDISNNLEGGTITNNQSIPPDEAAVNLNEGTSRKDQNTDRNNSFPDASARHNGLLRLIHTSGAPTLQEGANQIQEMPMTMQQANDQITRSQATESSQSSNFSFGIRGNPMNITPNANPSVMQATTQGKALEKAGLDQQQRNGQTSQNRQTQGKEVQAGHKDVERQKGMVSFRRRKLKRIKEPP
ncbi:hypothetical protein H5410_027572 [Solanum commersonii]|uniref:Uncharacterized protein n=1 Tax=Solanum commersonii TaxID=4109 RepID=A0A9J5Z288_SOLCO|nr:hypothetical protein H5410_027572 [Solanum commersonii]